MNDIHFVSKEVKHLYNKCDISFSSRNKLFKHLRKTCRKFKTFDAVFEASEAISGTFDIIFETFDTIFGAFEAVFETFETVFGISETISEVFDAAFGVGGTPISSEKFVALMANNVEVITIIHSIAELCDVIVKSGYNFRS